jgi:hypothetical protein
MSVLEEKIKKNKDLFDAGEPSEGHLDRFKDKLKELGGEEEPSGRQPVFRYWRIAAVIIVLIGISATLVWLVPGNQSNGVMAAQLPPDVQEVKQFYEDKTNRKLEQISQCSQGSDNPGALQEMIQQEIEELDASSEELEKELKENKENERVKNALLLNYKTKSDLLEDVIYRLCNI